MDIRRLFLDLVEYIFGMWRYRWLALGAAWIVALAGWFYVLKMPNQYDASARVFVDTRSILRPLLRDMAVTPDTMSQVRLVTQVMLSRPQLEAVAIRTGLDARATTERELESLLMNLRANTNISQMRGSEIFTIAYRDRDPVMARNVVQALLENFMESSIGKDRSDSAQAQRFLEQQIRQYEQRLNEAEERRAEFRKANMGLMPGQGGDYFSRLQAAEEAVRAVRGEIGAQIERRGELSRQAERFAAGGEIGPGGDLPNFPTSVDADISRLEQDLTSLRAQFTDRHPRVINVQATLESLYEARDAERRRLIGQQSPALAGQDVNPVWLELQVAISQTDVRLAELRNALRQREQAAENLRQMVDTIPEVEARLGRLDRDYDVVRSQYDRLVQRLETARLGDDVQVDAEGVSFEVIEPPRTPLTAAGPNRPLYFGGVLLLALGIGGAIALLLSQHSPVYFSAQRLSRNTGLPVFGQVGFASAHRTPPLNLFLFAFGLVALVAAALALVGGFAEVIIELRRMI